VLVPYSGEWLDMPGARKGVDDVITKGLSIPVAMALAMALKTLAHPFASIQALWLKAKLIARVMSVTGLGKVVSDQNPLPCN